MCKSQSDELEKVLLEASSQEVVLVSREGPPGRPPQPGRDASSRALTRT